MLKQFNSKSNRGRTDNMVIVITEFAIKLREIGITIDVL